LYTQLPQAIALNLAVDVDENAGAFGARFYRAIEAPTP
jgi:hypothetical protein